MKGKILPLLQILINIACVPLYFIAFIVGGGHLPVEGGGVTEKRFYHTPLENLTDMECAWLFYVSIAMIAVAVICSIFALVGKNKAKMRKGSLILSVASVAITAMAILLSTTVARGY